MQRKGEEREEREKERKERKEEGRAAGQVLVGFTEADWAYLLGVGENDRLLCVGRRGPCVAHAVLVSSVHEWPAIVLSNDDWSVVVLSETD